jgi:hypothetical protein
MKTDKTSEEINRDRRRFVETVAVGIAAAGSSGLFPKGTVAASEGDAIRPFRVNVPEQQLVDLRQRINTTKWPERETYRACSSRRLRNSRAIGEQITTGARSRRG